MAHICSNCDNGSLRLIDKLYELPAQGRDQLWRAESVPLRAYRPRFRVAEERCLIGAGLY